VVVDLAQRQAVTVCLAQQQAVVAVVAAATFARVAPLRNAGRIWMQGQQCSCNGDRRIETSDHRLRKTSGLRYSVHHTWDN
jgi:hypothetical protein